MGAADRTPVERWRFTTGGLVNHPPVVSEGMACFGDRAGGVYAVDVPTGELAWGYRHDTTAYNEVLGTPVVVDGLVLVDVDEWLFAHDRVTGAVQWSIKGVGGWLSVVGDAVLAIDGDRVAAWDLGSRQRRWRSRKIGGLLSAPPVQAGGLLVIAQAFEPNHVHGGLHALDPRTGRVAWSVETDGHACCRGDACEDQVMPAPFPVTPAGDLVWTTRLHDHSMGDLAYDVIGLDARTGQERIAYAASWLSGGEQVSGSVTVADGTLYCPAGDRLHAVEAMTGSLRWTHRTAAEIVGSAVRAGGMVLMATGDGQLHGLDTDVGATRWSVPLGEVSGWVDALENAAYDLVSTPFAQVDGLLYVATDAGVHALSAA